MLPINHLIRTLQATEKPWELLMHSGSTDEFFAASVFIDSMKVTVSLIDGHWYTLSVERNDLAKLLNKPIPLETTSLLTGEKGRLSFATQELKDDFLRHVPVMESPDKEAQ